MDITLLLPQECRINGWTAETRLTRDGRQYIHIALNGQGIVRRYFDVVSALDRMYEDL